MNRHVTPLREQGEDKHQPLPGSESADGPFAPPAECFPAACAQARSRFDVLVVDDDADTLEEMRDALDGAKLRVLTADSATRALQLLRENEICVLITDVRMPHITGMMLAALVRDEFGPEELELIFISAYAELDTVIESIRHVPSGFLLKPIDARELLLATFRALGARNATLAGRRQHIGAATTQKRGAGEGPPLAKALNGLTEAMATRPEHILDLMQRERRARERHFHPAVALTPAWQIIIGLYGIAKQNGHVHQSGIASRSGLPLSTVLRHVDQLVAHGCLERVRDPGDARRVRLTVTPQCIQMLERYAWEICGEVAMTRVREQV